MFDFDTLIIGGGPAGISAALNLKLRGKSLKLFSNKYEDSGLGKAVRVDNYPGMPGISGAQLLNSMYNHMREAEIPVESSQVLSVARVGKGFYVSAGDEVCSSRTVIIATGIVQSAFFPGEAGLLGRGISYCASCDGMLYRGKRVAVIALRNDAAEEANQLFDIGCEVTLINCGINTELLRPEISVIKGKDIEVIGGNLLKGVRVDGIELDFSCLFILRSTVAPDLLMPELEMHDGCVAVGAGMETNIPGLFAAGDCTGRLRQISKAVGEGQIAAHSAAKYLEGEYNNG